MSNLCACGGSHCSGLKAQHNASVRGCSRGETQLLGLRYQQPFVIRKNGVLINERISWRRYISQMFLSSSFFFFTVTVSRTHSSFTRSPYTFGQPHGGNGIF